MLKWVRILIADRKMTIFIWFRNNSDFARYLTLNLSSKCDVYHFILHRFPKIDYNYIFHSAIHFNLQKYISVCVSEKRVAQHTLVFTFIKWLCTIDYHLNMNILGQTGIKIDKLFSSKGSVYNSTRDPLPTIAVLFLSKYM